MLSSEGPALGDVKYKLLPEPMCGRRWDPRGWKEKQNVPVAATSPLAAEVHPAHGTLTAGDLDINEISSEKHPFMEGHFSGPSLFIGSSLCKLTLCMISDF